MGERGEEDIRHGVLPQIKVARPCFARDSAGLLCSEPSKPRDRAGQPALGVTCHLAGVGNGGDGVRMCRSKVNIDLCLE